MPYKNKEKQKEFQREWLWRKRRGLITKLSVKLKNKELKTKVTNEARSNQKEKKFVSTTRNRKWFKAYKLTLKCKRCGEHHPACLTFHHNNPKGKKYSVGDMILKAFSIETIKEEIKKCDVLCANCHAKLHWKSYFDL